jgi:tetratricopeptide (TPR) repeat protein
MKQADRAQLLAFERTHELKLSPRYRAFVSSGEARRHEGREATGVPTFTLDSRLELAFEAKPDRELFVDREVPRRDWRSWVPLATVDGEFFFFAVDVVKPDAPVSFHDGQRFLPVAKSLDTFLARLLRPKDPDLLEQARAAITKARKAHGRRRFADMLVALGDLPEVLAGFDPPLGDSAVAEVFNCQGVAFKELGRSKEARKSLQQAIDFGSQTALLTLMSLHLEEGRPDRTIAVGKDALFFDDRQAFWCKRYLLEAYLRKGLAADAARELRAIHEKHGQETELLAELRADLAELATKVPRRAKLIEEVLGRSR